MSQWALPFVLGLTLMAGTGFALAGDQEIPPPPTEITSLFPTVTPIPPHYEIPRQLADGWPVGDLRKEKVHFERIFHQVELAFQNPALDLHGLLVFRHGKLLLEEYDKGFDLYSFQSLNSCTKSVFSTLYGIAQDQGLLNLDEKISDLYPESAQHGWTGEKTKITIRNLLTFDSGLSNDFGGADPSPDDLLEYCFGRPLSHTPGEVWDYDGLYLVLISNLIARKSGMSFPDFAQKYLLGPLDIKGENGWPARPKGLYRVDYGLSWKARDMGKLGQLILNKGMWKGKRILSESWVKDSTTPHIRLVKDVDDFYGYLWYEQQPYGRGPVIIDATGANGQGIFICPDADLVCVLTSGSTDPQVYEAEAYLFWRGILGSFY